MRLRTEKSFVLGVAFELGLEERKDFLNGTACWNKDTEVWWSGVFTGRRAGWNGWSLEFKVDGLRSRMGLDYGEHDKPC